MSAYKYAVVLTGSIATGKSTLSSLLKLHGYYIIDADAIVHLLLEKNHEALKKMFGESVIKEEKVDRKEIGQIVFNDANKKKALEEFIHPLVKEEILKEALRRESFEIPYFVDVPLYFETDNYPEFEKVAVVYTPKERQLARLMKRNGMDEKTALSRIALQIDIEEKKKKADFVIDNSGDLKSLQKQIEQFLSIIKSTIQ